MLTFSRPGKSWNQAKVVEDPGKQIAVVLFHSRIRSNLIVVDKTFNN